MQVVKHEGWGRLYGGLTPSIVGTAASQVREAPFFLSRRANCFGTM